MKALSRIQGVFYFLTGVWPVIDIDSFMRVTGPKTDLWLVRTVGAILAINGLGFFVQRDFHFRLNAFWVTVLGLPFVLTIIDVYYVVSGTISPIYLGDAACEVALLLGWGYLLQAVI
jgi:hypothetical protein